MSSEREGKELVKIVPDRLFSGLSMQYVSVVHMEFDPVRKRLTCKLEDGDVRVFGIERAWITSKLEMACSGGFVNPANELVRSWKDYSGE